MKMRLLFDGDGQGDERRMNMLLKNIIKFANSSEMDEKIIETQYQRMLGQLTGIEFNMTKSRLVTGMNKREETNYADLEREIALGIEEAKKEIQETKLELEQAKQIRKNRLEYDELGKEVMEHPDRESSEARIRAINEEQAQLRQREATLERKLEERRKEFTLLINTIHQLQTLIFEEDGVSFSTEDDDTEPEPEVIIAE